MTRAGLNAGQHGDRGGALTHVHPAVWGARLARILESQRDLCITLEALSRHQAELIAAADTDGLLRILGERQGIVDEVTRLSEELEPLRAVWETSASLLAPDVRGKIGAVVEEIGRFMEKIGARDEADRVSLEARRAVVAKELGEISRGRGALAAYGGTRAPVGLGGVEDRNG